MESAQKSAKVATKPDLVTPAHGRGKLLTGGMPGNKGGGRPPDEFRALMRELASDEDSVAILRQILRGKTVEETEGEDGITTRVIEIDGDLYLKARDHAVKNGYGMPAQAVDVTTNGQAIQQVTIFGGLTIQF